MKTTTPKECRAEKAPASLNKVCKLKKTVMGLVVIILFSSPISSAAQLNWKPLDAFQKSTKSGVRWGQQGKFGKAVSAFTEAIYINPNYAKAYNNRGIALFGQGFHAKAIQDFSKAIEIEPNYADAYYNRGKVKALLGDEKSALKDYENALKTNPHFADAYFAKGSSYEKMGDMDQATVFFKKALKLAPQNPKFYFKVVAMKKGTKLASMNFLDNFFNRNEIHKKSYYQKVTFWGNNQ